MDNLGVYVQVIDQVQMELCIQKEGELMRERMRIMKSIGSRIL